MTDIPINTENYDAGMKSLLVAPSGSARPWNLGPRLHDPQAHLPTSMS